jgi:hypothetical protein
MEFSCTSEVQTFLYIGRETFTSVLSHTRVRLGRDLCEILGSGKPPDRKKKKKKLSHARSDAQPCVVQQDLCRPLWQTHHYLLILFILLLATEITVPYSYNNEAWKLQSEKYAYTLIILIVIAARVRKREHNGMSETTLPTYVSTAVSMLFKQLCQVLNNGTLHAGPRRIFLSHVWSTLQRLWNR